MDRFGIILDIGEAQEGVTWYTGGSAAGIGAGGFQQIDFWSTLTHEYGHALGFLPFTNGHFTNAVAGTCPGVPTGSDNTMCSGAAYNATYARTLESHDIHTFDGAY